MGDIERKPEPQQSKVWMEATGGPERVDPYPGDPPEPSDFVPLRIVLTPNLDTRHPAPPAPFPGCLLRGLTSSRRAPCLEWELPLMEMGGTGESQLSPAGGEVPLRGRRRGGLLI